MNDDRMLTDLQYENLKDLLHISMFENWISWPTAHNSQRKHAIEQESDQPAPSDRDGEAVQAQQQEYQGEGRL